MITDMNVKKIYLVSFSYIIIENSRCHQVVNSGLEI
jgi:hypothetical protein